MMYNIDFTAEAREGLARLERNEPKPPSSYSFSLFMSAMTNLISA